MKKVGGYDCVVIGHASGNLTGYFREMPWLLAQGANDSELRRELMKLLESWIQKTVAFSHN